MIEFLYTGSYITIDAAPSFSIFIHTKVHGLALKYNIHGLITFSATRFSAALRHVSNLEVYFQSIHEVYNQPFPSMNLQEQSQNKQQPLRTEVVDAALVELKNILSAPAVLVRFQQICTEVPQFHADFLNSLLESKVEADNSTGSGRGEGGETSSLCENCGPSEDGYEVEVQCTGCGMNCLYAFH